MKNKFLNYSMNLIKRNNDFDEIKLEEIAYGLEAFYMLCTKLIVIIAISIIFNVFQELILFLAIYTPLRGLGFGFHANSNIECWLISIPTFTIIPLMIKYLTFSPVIAQVIIIFSAISFLFFGPADTINKPLINTKKRLVDKSLLVIITLIYLFLTVIIENTILLNTITVACLWQAICVNPLMYKLFKQPYNNYKNYIIKNGLN